jgi:hypothetical protein
MGRSAYLTARCPTGCEAWLHPYALDQHVDGRCRGHPWVDDLPDTAVIPASSTDMILGTLDEALISTVGLEGSSRVDARDGRLRNPAPLHAGSFRLHSPLDGIRARRWLVVALAAADRWGSDGVGQALEPERFRELENELLAPGSYLDCPVCGAFVSSRALRNHQTTSASCGWRRAAFEVRCAWRHGWRDPCSVPQAPKTWGELSRSSRWKRQLRTTVFPRWIAVLLPPKSGAVPHSTQAR